MLLAEDMRDEEAAAALQKYGTRSRPASLFRSAWNHVEYGVHAGASGRDKISQVYFEYAQELTAMTLDHPRASQDDQLGALVLASYMPVFEKRGRDEIITPQDCARIYDSLGAAISYLRPLDIDEPPQWAMAETAVLALSARTSQPELLLYPTSPREETSKLGALNHDSYFFVDKNKIPLQQKLIKTQKEYDDWITILTLQPLVEKGYRRSQVPRCDTLSDQVNMLMSLIVADTHGQRLDKSEQRFLNFMSEAIVSHRFNATQHEQAA